MSRPICRDRLSVSAFLLATLLLGTVFQSTCQIDAPGVYLTLDESSFHLEAPGVTINVEPGRVEVNSSPVRYDFGS